MVKIYHRRIVAKDINPVTEAAWTIDDVPSRWREEVLALLEEAQD